MFHVGERTNQPRFGVAIDFAQAFDSVPRKALFDELIKLAESRKNILGHELEVLLIDALARLTAETTLTFGSGDEQQTC